MSKIAKKPVQIKEGVTVTLDGNVVKVVGPKGEQSFSTPSGILVKIEGDELNISQKDKNDHTKKALSGLTRALINNMIKGVSQGFEKATLKEGSEFLFGRPTFDDPKKQAELEERLRPKNQLQRIGSAVTDPFPVYANSGLPKPVSIPLGLVAGFASGGPGGSRRRCGVRDARASARASSRGSAVDPLQPPEAHRG